QHPIDAGARCDHAPIAAAEQRKGEADDEQREERQRRAEHARRCRRVDARRAEGCRLLCGFRIHYTRRCWAELARPAGRTSRTKMKTVNTATEAKMPPTRKFAVCWNRPSRMPAATAPRLLPSPPSATGTKP